MTMPAWLPHVEFAVVVLVAVVAMVRRPRGAIAQHAHVEEELDKRVRAQVKAELTDFLKLMRQLVQDTVQIGIPSDQLIKGLQKTDGDLNERIALEEQARGALDDRVVVLEKARTADTGIPIALTRPVATSP